MKIKDGIVISKSDLEYCKDYLTIGWFNSTHTNYVIKQIDKIIKESQPLEPIIRDAYFKEDALFELTEGDFNDYINGKEI